MLGGSLLSGIHGFHCPNHSIASAKPRRSHQRPTASNIATKCFVWWAQPAGTRQECSPQCRQSSVNLLCQFGYHVFGSLRRSVMETVDLVLRTSYDVGEHR